MSLLDVVNEAKEPSKHFFGLNEFDIWECVLAKGVGKVPFDAAMHKESEKRHAIKIVVSPLPGSGINYNTEREVIAESRDWAGIVLPTIHKLGLTPAQVDKHYVQIELVPARKYTDKNGEEKVATLPAYVAVYASQEECEAAASEFFGNGAGSVSSSVPANGNGAAAPAAAAPAPAGMTREAAVKFLPAMLAAAGGDPMKAAEILAKNPILSPFFDINSPEVLEILMKQVA